MCGRFSLENVEKIFVRFDAENAAGLLAPRYNIAPGQEVPVVIRKSPNKVVLMRWGLIPHWAKDPKIGYKMINARAETIESKPSFKSSLRSKRCIIPADGFYEWWKPTFSRARVPYFVGLKEHELFSFAGLYDEWKDPSGKTILSFTIITVPANKLVSVIHDRMPAILKIENEATWLDGGIDDTKKLNEILKPYDSKEMKSYQVSSLVNKAAIDTKEMIEPIQRLDAKNFKNIHLSDKKSTWNI